MWSSGQSGLNNWALQSQKYQNMNHEEVDWAQLAKQWIKMKDASHSAQQMPTGPAALAAEILQQSMQPPPPPPMPPTSYVNEQLQPPGVSEVVQSTNNVENTASIDMEIEEDKESFSNQTHNNGESWKNWSYNTGEEWDNNQMHQNWDYNWPNRLGPQSQNTDIMPPGQSSKDQADNYWSSQNMIGTSSGIMMQKIVDYGHKDRKGFPRHSFPGNNNIKDTDIDAAQRKSLPPWLRDGLEKMEREKQKVNEREKMQSNQKELLRKNREAEEKARNLLKECDDSIPIAPIVKSKFDTDSEQSDEPEEGEIACGPRETKVENNQNELTTSEEKGHGFDRILSEEEKMEEMMSFLKLIMTEILLDVTTDFLRNICADVIGKATKKVQQQKKSPGLATYTGNLGLGMYSSESDDESNSNETEEAADRTPLVDSDEELRQTIYRKRRDFEVIERDIFLRLQKEEGARRKISKPESRTSSPESSSSREKASSLNSREESQKSKESSSDTAEASVIEPVNRESSSGNESESNSERSESRSSSSYARKKKKKKKKSKSHRDSSENSEDHQIKRRKKRNKSEERYRSRSTSRLSKIRPRSRSRSAKRRFTSRDSRSRSRSRRSTYKRYSRSRSPYSRSSRHKKSRKRRSRSRHDRRSISRTRYDRRHRRSRSLRQASKSRRRDSRSISRRRERKRRRSRSVEIKERSKIRSKS